MATWDNAYLLSALKRRLARPTADEIVDATYYTWLSESQNAIIADISARAPWILYPKVGYAMMPTLTSVDSQVFTFLDSTGSAVDSNGYPIVPIGKVCIYPSLASIPDYPWQEGYDYLNEGSQIRIPNNRTYTGTLYWRGIEQPVDIDASHQPALIPEASRNLIVLRAAFEFADAGVIRPDLAQRYEQKYGDAFARWMLVWKRQFASGGAMNRTLMRPDTIGTSLGSIVVTP